MKNYSRRELYALGEPFGNSSTTTKVGGGRIYGSGGGSSSQPTNQNYTTSNIAPWAQQGVSSLINSGMHDIYPNMTTNADGSISLGNQKGYVPFNAQSTDPATQQALAAGQSQVAGFTPLQNQSFQTAANMQNPNQYNTATDLGNQAGYGSLGTANQANAYGQLGTAQGLQGSNIGNSLGQQSQNTSQGPGSVASYMNPYIQNTLNPSMQLLNQQYGQQAAQEQGNATRSGAFGGSREALMGGLNSQNQMLANNQLVGNAYNQAFTNAQQQMNTANQAALAGNAQAMQGTQLGLQGVQGQQAGYQGANQASANLANVGTQQLAGQQGIAQLQNQMGAQQQQNAQNQLSFGAQNFANMQNYPMTQLAQLESMYTGAPQNVQTLGYQAPPSLISQIGGLGMAGAGAYGLYNNMTKNANAKGGIIKYSSGGIVSLGLHKAMKGRA